MEDDSPRKSPRDSPRDNPKGSKNICYYEDKMDELTGFESSTKLNERIKHLEVIIARLLRFMPHLERPDWDAWTTSL